MSRRWSSCGGLCLLIVAALALEAGAQSTAAKTGNGKLNSSDSMNLKPGDTVGSRVTEQKSETVTTSGGSEGCEVGNYREVSDFFNIREANPSVHKGEWEFEVTSEWFTRSNHDTDDVELEPSLKYGVTDDIFVELAVYPLLLGHGDDVGNGDLLTQVFWRVIRESEYVPAFATWAEMRIPSGDDSSGVDGTLHFNLTKSWGCKFRTNFEGWIMTANGHHGAEESGDNMHLFGLGLCDNDEPGRRPFQWGLGPGFDYQFDEKTIGVLNYLMRSSEERGQHDSNILEIGAVRQLTKSLYLKAAVDVGLDGQEETPNLGAKLQFDYEWGGCD